MQYPSHSTQIITNTHLEFSDLMALYDQFTALGFMLLPRMKGQKFPIAKYWKKGVTTKREDINRATIEKDQHETGLSGWCIVTGERSGRLIALDFDTQAITEAGNNPQDILDKVQSLSPSLFAFTTPSGGLHILYRQPEQQDLLSNSKTPVLGLDKRGEGGQIASLGSYIQYFGEKATSKGLTDGHGDFYRMMDGADYSFVPEMSDDLYQWLLATEKKERLHNEGESYAETKTGKARLEKHFAQPDNQRDHMVIQALTAILRKWGKKSYEEWMRMWMSAHHASQGSLAVRDFIMMHPDILWTGEPEEFRRVWDEHRYREQGGYTAASLFWLARSCGWLTKTGMEIHANLTSTINTRYIKTWVDSLEELPQRLLLMSQTGSGKTYTLKTLYERLNQPKTVVFVPSIKLALELTATLVSRHGLPAVCYYDQETHTSIPVSKMVKAPILVTTLQTFATKVKVPMEKYGLVYVEESDQLIAQFARGGGGSYSSQVSEKEARAGFATLRQAFENSAYVWCVDATMSNVTYNLANAMTSIPLSVIRNIWVEKKANVKMVDTVGRALQEVLRALGLGKKVVVPCDTARQAEEVIEVMQEIGALEGKRALAIIRNEERNPEVIEFMEDVNARAPLYDLLAYNSVMASGVSITDFTPDVVVQICQYLTPRVNIQILNRYRSQKEVYVYYRASENLYTRSDDAILDRAKLQAMIEGTMINLTPAERSDDALLRGIISSISVADSETQNRAPREFYMQLLADDGRVVDDADATPVTVMISDARKRVNELKQERKDELKRTWRETPPINRDNPAPAGYTDLQMAQGEIHDEIAYILRGNIPSDVDNETIYDVAKMFANYSVPLGSMLDQEWAIRKAETYLADANKAVTAFRNNLTMVKVMGLMRYMYPKMDAEITPEQLAKRTPEFLMMVSQMHEAYDAVIERNSQKFEVIWNKYEDKQERALAFSKIILARVGLKQKSERLSQKDGEVQYGYRIGNIRQAVTFLKWRSPELKPTLDWGTSIIDDTFIRRIGLTKKANDAIMAIMTSEGVSYEDALNLYETKERF